jgi:toxin ParE1/3/4
MGRLERTAASRLDYLEIFLYVAEQNLPAAESLLRTFDDTLEKLADMPGMGRARPELGRDARSFPVGNYLIIYRPVVDGIHLLRVVHGARNLRRLFKKK